MLEILLWSGVIVSGSFIYGLLGGTSNVESTKEKRDLYKETYNYCSNLTTDDLLEYIDYNYDLNYYKDNIYKECDLTNKHSLSKKIADISERTGKPFTNIYKRY